MRLSSVLLARCPSCHEGPVLYRVFGTHRRCSVCDYDFHPEPGFYLGAMAISFLMTAILLVPPMVLLKYLEADLAIILAYPFLQFIVVGSLLAVYSKVLWLHLEHRMTSQLDGKAGLSERERSVVKGMAQKRDQ